MRFDTLTAPVVARSLPAPPSTSRQHRAPGARNLSPARSSSSHPSSPRSAITTVHRHAVRMPPCRAECTDVRSIDKARWQNAPTRDTRAPWAGTHTPDPDAHNRNRAPTPPEPPPAARASTESLRPVPPSGRAVEPGSPGIRCAGGLRRSCDGSRSGRPRARAAEALPSPQPRRLQVGSLPTTPTFPWGGSIPRSRGRRRRPGVPAGTRPAPREGSSARRPPTPPASAADESASGTTRAARLEAS